MFFIQIYDVDDRPDADVVAKWQEIMTLSTDNMESIIFYADRSSNCFRTHVRVIDEYSEIVYEKFYQNTETEWDDFDFCEEYEESVDWKREGF